MIRSAILPDDRARILIGARDFVRRMNGAEFLPTAPDKFDAAVDRVIGLPGVEIYVGEVDGAIKGGIGVLYAPFLWNPEWPWADELFWWCAQDAPNSFALRLIRHADHEMRRRGVRGRTFAQMPSSPDALGAVYRNLGLHPAQTVWAGFV